MKMQESLLFDFVKRESGGRVREMRHELIILSQEIVISVRIGKHWTERRLDPKKFSEREPRATETIDGWCEFLRLTQAAVRAVQPSLEFAVLCMDCRKPFRFTTVPDSTGLCDRCAHLRETGASLYHCLVAMGIEVDHHESDLYFPASAVTLALLRRFPDQGKIAKSFKSEIDGKRWIEVPFAFMPFWERRAP